MEEVKYAFEGKITFAPKNVTEFQGKKKFGFKIEGQEDWFSFYQSKEQSDEEFKTLMETDFKRGFLIKFNEVQSIVTDYVIVDRTESQGKSWAPREDPKQKAAGMLIAYVKDLIVAGKVELKDLETESQRMLKLYTELSK